MANLAGRGLTPLPQDRAIDNVRALETKKSNRKGRAKVKAEFDETIRKQTWSSLSSFAGVEGRGVHIDPNPVLPNPSGPGVVPNPNYEQMYVIYAPLYNPDSHKINNWRAQLVYDARLPWGISQRLVFGANYRHEEYARIVSATDSLARKSRAAASPAPPPTTPTTSSTRSTT